MTGYSQNRENKASSSGKEVPHPYAGKRVINFYPVRLRGYNPESSSLNVCATKKTAVTGKTTNWDHTGSTVNLT